MTFGQPKALTVDDAPKLAGLPVLRVVNAKAREGTRTTTREVQKSCHCIVNSREGVAKAREGARRHARRRAKPPMKPPAKAREGAQSHRLTSVR